MNKNRVDVKKANHDQTILFKAKNSIFPDVGVWQDFGDRSEVYIPSNDDVEIVENIEWWSPIPE